MAITKNKKAKNYITRIRKSKILKSKGVDTLKYCGTIQLKGDALVEKAIRFKNPRFHYRRNIVQPGGFFSDF